MKPLQDVAPTPEQLKIINQRSPGVSVIRGAAGSGKTTTALCRLRFLAGFRIERERRRVAQEGGAAAPVRILVLTYNRTLRGYIDELARTHLREEAREHLEVSTFAKWALEMSGGAVMADPAGRNTTIAELGAKAGLQYEPAFLASELAYILGRYLPGDRQNYITSRREGRGASPRVDQAARERILAEVVAPYEEWKSERGLRDWNDIALSALGATTRAYDIIVIDEAQDFTAVQARAVMCHAAPQAAVTFVLDAAQRIYPPFFTWADANITVPPGASHRLTRNYRNTIEIAEVARVLLDGMDIGADGTLPDTTASKAHGPKPVVFCGRFSAQTDKAVEYIRARVDLERESVAFLHPKGGGWFKYVRNALYASGIPYTELAQQNDWPTGPESVALSTIHSAKGLEFDHVIAIGLGAETLVHGADAEDDQRAMLRRLLAMGIGRARKSVVLGYKPGDESPLVDVMVERGLVELVRL